MPLYAIIGKDGPRGLELRKLHREAHLANLTSRDRRGEIPHAGPLLDEGGNPAGSVIILEAANLAEAQSIAKSDPYVVEGIFESFEVYETRAVFPSRSREGEAR